ncbi:MAG: hypothetical protein ACI4WG_01710 [Erysipelotrichaceae bacterium]
MNNLFSKEWIRLDTAALIFPATMNSKWSNVFRLSATLKEEINPDILQQAVNDLRSRFPGFYVGLKYGFFWCYLQKSKTNPIVQMDYSYPLTYMGKKELRNNCLRVLYFKNRIAIELFHSIGDGTSGRIFLCTLVAHYLQLKKGLTYKADKLFLDVSQQPEEEELKDRFKEFSNNYPASRKEDNSFKLTGTRISYYFSVLTTGIISTDELLAKAHQYNCTITVFLAAVMCESLIELQNKKASPTRMKSVKVTIPVNLRKVFDTTTLRNFVLTVNVGVNPKKGEYSLQQLCNELSHQLAYETTSHNMASRIAANVNPEINKYLRIFPLFIKNAIMNLVYRSAGEKKGSLNISNLGNTNCTEQFKNEIERMEFIVGVQKSYPNNCGVLSFNGKTYINMIRNIKESDLERLFFSKLVREGINVKIESNWR